jgi:uncharacterized protein YprB with RNaseH-like and TPR domain
MSISNCQFSGVHFDAPAIEAVRVVAEGLLKNAEGLLTLARVLNASDVKIESLLKIEQPITAKRTLKLKDRSK